MQKTRKRLSGVSPEDFVKAWQGSSGGHAEVAKKLNMTVSGVSSRAAMYRKRGIKLKKLSTRGGRPRRNALNVFALNKLIASMNAVNGRE